MLRRDLIKLLMVAGSGLGTTALATNKPFRPYEGPFYFTLTADGGWDVTSFCDPKDSRKMNNWAKKGRIQTAKQSNIRYAPFANNQAFFDKYAKHMLVINGIDCQTNAHNAGSRHMWSGNFNLGYPSVGALAAASYGKGLPLPYISFGGYRETADLVTTTLLDEPEQLANLIQPNIQREEKARFFHDQNYTLLQQARQQRVKDLRHQHVNQPRFLKALDHYQAALDTAPALRRLEQQYREGSSIQSFNNPLAKQIRIGMAAARAGLTVGTDLVLDGFDTHDNHDQRHTTALNQLVEGIDLFWQEAEHSGLSDQVVLVVGSEFGRTPEYNDGKGKDHWPIGSMLVMKKQAPWLNQTLGATNDAHEALALNSQLQPVDPDAGVLIQPKHIHNMLRHLTGVENGPLASALPLFAEDLPLANILRG